MKFTISMEVAPEEIVEIANCAKESDGESVDKIVSSIEQMLTERADLTDEDDEGERENGAIDSAIMELGSALVDAYVEGRLTQEHIQDPEVQRALTDAKKALTDEDGDIDAAIDRLDGIISTYPEAARDSKWFDNILGKSGVDTMDKAQNHAGMHDGLD